MEQTELANNNTNDNMQSEAQTAQAGTPAAVPADTPKPKSKGRRVFSVVFVIANLALVAFIIYLSMAKTDAKFSDLVNARMNVWYILLGVLFLYLAQMFESARMQLLIYKTARRFSPALSVKTAMLGRYYDLITPLMTGGKPYQMYYLRSRGLKGADATGVPLTDLLAQKLGFSVFALIILGTCHMYLDQIGDPTLKTVVITGFIINLVISAVIIFISTNRRVTEFIMHGLIAFFHKVRFIKDKQRAIAKSDANLAEYRTAIRRLVKNPLVILGVFGLTALVYLCYAVVLFFIYAAFAGTAWGLFPIILLAVVSFENIAGVVPLPGGTGVVELTFIEIFTGLPLGGNIFAALIIWKAVTYVLPIANGLSVMLYDAGWGNRKNARIQMNNKK
jgi:uncharacterized protein (TIRG00374 family)